MVRKDIIWNHRLPTASHSVSLTFTGPSLHGGLQPLQYLLDGQYSRTKANQDVPVVHWQQIPPPSDRGANEETYSVRPYTHQQWGACRECEGQTALAHWPWDGGVQGTSWSSTRENAKPCTWGGTILCTYICWRPAWQEGHAQCQDQRQQAQTETQKVVMQDLWPTWRIVQCYHWLVRMYTKSSTYSESEHKADVILWLSLMLTYLAEPNLWVMLLRTALPLRWAWVLKMSVARCAFSFACNSGELDGKICLPYEDVGSIEVYPVWKLWLHISHVTL